MEVSMAPKDVLRLGRHLVRELESKTAVFRCARRHGILTQLEHIDSVVPTK
jgi:hypothetical protein